jgi:hypothetical protein
MPPKRRSFLDQLAQETQPQAEPVRIDATPSNTNAAPPARAQSDKIKSSLYLPPDVMDRLREIAFHERCKMHDLFLEGIDRVIEGRGHPERARPKTAS